MAALENVAIGIAVVVIIVGCMVFGDRLASGKRHADYYYCQNASTPNRNEVVALQKGTATDQEKARHTSNERYHELCNQWRSAQAAEDATEVAWLQLGFGLMGLFGLIYTIRFAAQSALAASNQLTLSNAPRLVIKNIRISEKGAADPADPPELAPGKVIEGFAWVLSAGTAPTVVRHKECVIGWHIGELPMFRPFDTDYALRGTAKWGEKWRHAAPLRTKKVDGSPWPETTRLKYDSIAGWEFETTVPGDYTKDMSLYFMGYIQYLVEGYDSHRILRFARRYDPAKRRFVPVPDNPDYEGHD